MDGTARAVIIALAVRTAQDFFQSSAIFRMAAMQQRPIARRIVAS